MSSPPSPLPFSAPAWLSPRRVALVAITLGALMAALPAVWDISEARGEIGSHRGAQLAMAASTALLSVLLARLALRAATGGGAARWCLLGGMIAGAMNAGLSLAAVTLVRHGDPGRALAGLLLGGFFGSFYGGPLGLLFGGAYLVVVVSARRALGQPSHDGADRVLITAGLWLAAAVVAVRVLTPPGSPTALPLSAVFALGATAAVVGAARRWARSRWLHRVAAGQAPGWQIVARSGGEQEEGLLPMVREQATLDGVLLRVRTASDPYRRAPDELPAALVPLPLHEVDAARALQSTLPAAAGSGPQPRALP